MTSRIYIVRDSGGGESLVDAGTPAQAIRHVTHGIYEAKPATPKDVARLMDEGVKVETAARDKGEEATEAATRG